MSTSHEPEKIPAGHPVYRMCETLKGSVFTLSTGAKLTVMRGKIGVFIAGEFGEVTKHISLSEEASEILLSALLTSRPDPRKPLPATKLLPIPQPEKGDPASLTPVPKPTRVLKPGEPCDHPGCLSHVSHPCESCGRIAGQGNYTLKHPWVVEPAVDVKTDIYRQVKRQCTKSGCTRVARYYGPLGGYGKLCDQHANEKCEKQRAARKRRKELELPTWRVSYRTVSKTNPPVASDCTMDIKAANHHAAKDVVAKVPNLSFIGSARKLK